MLEKVETYKTKYLCVCYFGYLFMLIWCGLRPENNLLCSCLALGTFLDQWIFFLLLKEVSIN